MNQKGVAVVISYVHQITPAITTGGGVSPSQNDRVNTVRLASLAQKDAIRNNGNIVILLTDQLTSVSSQVRQNNAGIQPIFVPKPTRTEREAFLQSVIDSGMDEWKECVPKNFDIKAFSLATQGMSYRQIQEIFLRCKEAGTKITLEFVKKKKREILNAEYGDLLEIIEPELGLEDIGGLDHIKAYLKNILGAIQKNEVRLVPMGITLMGPPGTGKTAICESLAKEAGFNFVRVKNVRSMWVGESEGRMQTLLYALRSLAPVVVMNDEADQTDNKRNESSGDSGTSNRLRKAWMEFLSDPKIRGQVLVINCTNRPDLIDVALKRSGRSDDRIAMLLPSKEERSLIFKVMFKRHKIQTEITDFSIFIQETEGLSGADIEKIVLNAFRFANQKSKKAVDEEAIAEALDDFIPSADQAEIDRMTILAIRECSSKRLLPNNVKDIINRIKDRGLIMINPEIMNLNGR
jgi:ATP-dependent 26S proteasome regulatory subunit